MVFETARDKREYYLVGERGRSLLGGVAFCAMSNRSFTPCLRLPPPPPIDLSIADSTTLPRSSAWAFSPWLQLTPAPSPLGANDRLLPQCLLTIRGVTIYSLWAL